MSLTATISTDIPAVAVANAFRAADVSAIGQAALSGSSADGMDVRRETGALQQPQW